MRRLLTTAVLARRKTHVQGLECTGRSSGGRIAEVNCKLQT